MEVALWCFSLDSMSISFIVPRKDMVPSTVRDERITVCVTDVLKILTVDRKKHACSIQKFQLITIIISN